MCSGRPPPPVDIAKDIFGRLGDLLSTATVGPGVISFSTPLVPLLLTPLCFRVQDGEVLSDLCWIMADLMEDGSSDVIRVFLDAGLVDERLVNLLNHPSRSVQEAALATICRIAAGSVGQKQVVIDAGVPPCLCALLSSSEISIRVTACRIVTHISSGSSSQVQVCVGRGADLCLVTNSSPV